MLRRVQVITLLVVVVFLAACGGKDVTTGTVVKKSHEDAWVQYVQTCTYFNLKGGCEGYIFTPIYWPEIWSLKLRDDNEDRPISDRDTSWVEISAADFERYQVNDRYPAEGS